MIEQGPPTLQETCCKAVLRLITLYNVLYVLDFAQHAHIPQSPHLEEAALSFIARTFDAVVSHFGKERVESAIGSSRFEALTTESLAAERLRRRISYTGRVLERATVPLSSSEVEAGAAQVVRCGQTVLIFPASALRDGVAWPAGVDPAHRERHLSDEEFESLLGSSPGAFYALPDWKQLQLKKQARLF